MKRLIACLALLGAGLIIVQTAHAEQQFTGNYHFNAFEHNVDFCKQIVRSLHDGYPYDEMNVSTDGNTVRLDDYKYYKRRYSARMQRYMGGKGFATKIIEISCYSDGDVRIRYRMPLEDGNCSTEGGYICPGNDYKDEPQRIKDYIEIALERYKHRGTYRIYMYVTPSDARIRITNIKPRFESGMYLAPGRYDFEVSRPGYQTRKFYIEHKAETGSYELELKRLAVQHRGTYRIYINVTPSDARIRITNIKPRFEDGMYLAPGRYDFEVSRSGYQTGKFYIEHKAETESFKFELKRLAVRKGILILAYPEDARVEMLGIREHYEPGMKLPFGSYRVRVSKPGFETKTFTVEVNDSSDIKILDLERNMAGKKTQCRDERSDIAEAIATGSYEGKKVSAKNIEGARSLYNEQCEPLGFDPL